ncbi:MAG: hypothetical protein HC896_10685, partial [Bacteroidales bacterium]|nr:hypothetical protein [Bacteroidales bacterium]
IEAAIRDHGIAVASVLSGNRNFEGRQGPGARTMLASPLTAAAVAVTGVITNPVELM